FRQARRRRHQLAPSRRLPAYRLSERRPDAGRHGRRFLSRMERRSEAAAIRALHAVQRLTMPAVGMALEERQGAAVGENRRVLYADRHAYCAHPHLAVVAEDRWLMVFNRTMRRDVIIHPPQDPQFQNLLMISRDQGESWGPAEVVPAYGWSGVECAGRTSLGEGRVLLNQWRFRWYPL